MLWGLLQGSVFLNPTEVPASRGACEPVAEVARDLEHAHPLAPEPQNQVTFPCSNFLEPRAHPKCTRLKGLGAAFGSQGPTPHSVVGPLAVVHWCFLDGGYCRGFNTYQCSGPLFLIDSHSRIFLIDLNMTLAILSFRSRLLVRKKPSLVGSSSGFSRILRVPCVFIVGPV